MIKLKLGPEVIVDPVLSYDARLPCLLITSRGEDNQPETLMIPWHLIVRVTIR